jgi:ATP-dependent DNA helicase RecG
MITVTLSSDKSIAYVSPCLKNGLLYDTLVSEGGFQEHPAAQGLTMPISTKTALALRAALTGKGPLSISPEVGQHLASSADVNTVVSPNIFVAQNEKFAIIDASRIPLKDALSWKSFVNGEDDIRLIMNGFYSIPLLSIDKVATKFPKWIFSDNSKKYISNPFADFADDLELEIPEETDYSIAEEYSANPVILPSLPAFSEYDGYLIALKDTPLTDFEYVRKDLEKVTKANEKLKIANAKAKDVAKAAGKPAPKPKPMQKSLMDKLVGFGINNAFDVLHQFPLRHIDRSHPQLIRNLKVGDEAAVFATIVSKQPYDRVKRLMRFTVKDSSGAMMTLTFFSQYWLSGMFFEGDEVIVHGKYAPFNGKPSMSSPSMDKVGDERARLPLIPVYPQSEKNKITTWDILSLVKETIARIQTMPLSDPLPDEVLKEYDIPSRNDAYRDIHIPNSKQAFENARRRLVYEELLRLQLFIQHQKNDIKQRRGMAQDALVTPSVDKFYESLPYTLTGAQSRAIKAIDEDMATNHPMHRLVQGDVGAGKSTILEYCLLKTVDNGHQGAALAPTEILAEQLYFGVAKSVEGLISPRTGQPMNVKFLGGKTKIKERREIKETLANGLIDIIVGTHAILTEDTVYSDLGTVVIDEQHRFGVEQRTALRNARTDGLTPDMLVMTATPIPRSSAMVLYGDLDITILDELPPGRTPIETIWIRTNAQESIDAENLRPWQDIKEQIAEGHQAYIVASLVEDNDKIAAQSVEEAYETLSNGIFADYRMGMVHGKQNRVEREQTMAAFSKGDIDILVSTTVIEVGVNVPNSTIMVVLDPGRFGISQLHQIRGRVGRSKFASRCYLVGDTKTPEGEARLNALVESTDGFYLSEKDLELRGEGTLFSTAQSGQSDLYLANIRDNLAVLEIAKKDAEKILERNGSLRAHPENIFKEEINVLFGSKTLKS